ncbi:MAG TPA: MFS transporter [Ktedonobacteraceae bacterium]|nr:MFS transporter [Ktedonobacteraceae bacterium]
MLGVEFLNEWFSNLLAAVLPAVKSVLGLNYIQVSLLFTLLEGSDVLSDGIFGVIGDLWSRRVLITAGTIVAGLGLVCMGIAPGYLVLLLGVILHGFAGGPFVGLSQASLVDTSPGKHEQMMAWWTLAGDIGFLITPLMVTAAYALGVDWRPLFLLGAALFFIYALFLAAMRFPRPSISTGEAGEVEEVEATISSNLAAIKAAALNLDLLRWAVILPLLDMPVNAFIVLYFHDVVGLNIALASSTLLIIIVSALVGRTILPWLLHHSVSGIRLLRLNVWLGVISFGAFLLVPYVGLKFVLLALFALAESSWYPLAKGQAYAAQPGKSGVVLSVTSLLSPIASLLPLLVGVIATQAGLAWGLAVLLVGPVVAGVLLLVGKRG